MISSCFMSELEGQTRADQKANTGFNNKWLGVFAPPYLLLKQEDHREEKRKDSMSWDKMRQHGTG